MAKKKLTKGIIGKVGHEVGQKVERQIGHLKHIGDFKYISLEEQEAFVIGQAGSIKTLPAPNLTLMEKKLGRFKPIKQEMIAEIQATISQLRQLKRVTKKHLGGDTVFAETEKQIQGVVNEQIKTLKDLSAWMKNN